MKFFLILLVPLFAFANTDEELQQMKKDSEQYLQKVQNQVPQNMQQSLFQRVQIANGEIPDPNHASEQSQAQAGQQVANPCDNFAGGIPAIDPKQMNFGNSFMDKIMQKGVALATNKDFMKDFSALATTNKRMNCIFTQIAVFLMFMIIKSYQVSKSPHWSGKMFNSVLYSIISLVMVSYVIPSVIIGSPFRNVAKTVWVTFSHWQ